MNSIILSQKEIKKMPILPNPDNKKNIKIFSEDEILKIVSSKEYPNLERKYDLSENLEDIKALVIPKLKVKNEKNQIIGAIYKRLNYPRFQEGNSLDINFYILRHKKIETILQQCFSKRVINTDLLTYNNLLVNLNDFYMIDYEDMQIEDCSTQIMSGSIPQEIVNQHKYFSNGLFTYNVVPLIQIIFFLKDLLNFSFQDYFHLKKEDPQLAYWYLKYYGVDNCQELFRKVNLLIGPNRNEFLEETLDELGENYYLQNKYNTRGRILVHK